MIGQKGTYVCGAEHPSALGAVFDCDAGVVDVFQDSVFCLGGWVGHGGLVNGVGVCNCV